MRKIFVAGHNGMVGSAVTRKLKTFADVDILTQERSQLNLEDQSAVGEYLQTARPDEVYLCAARVGGIQANNIYPADFIHSNLVIQTNIINAAFQSGVSKLLFLGSSCIYPRSANQPMAETELLAGQLESTNEPYAIAKIAGIKLCESFNRQHGTDFRSVMPTNLYGPEDNFHAENSHVIPALMRRIHEAKINQHDEVTIWGSGAAMREFLHVDDMASACIYVMNQQRETYHGAVQPMLSHINVGTGQDVTIRELAQTLVDVIGFSGDLKFDTTKPDGTPRKLLDVSKLGSMGWNSKISLTEGLADTYRWFVENYQRIRA